MGTSESEHRKELFLNSMIEVGMQHSGEAFVCSFRRSAGSLTLIRLSSSLAPLSFLICVSSTLVRK